ncbi:hypothetical protein METBIDRAFT_167151 [Metschnikowia bicuspidata var. bicuspidata NRRL YB-4993]|uniref:CST complex subunit Stn1 N-terminal domain-containing protein n=1 Tax=Metschnikowia bicuspidata var. bicuspidata NRRL YB-4993 TaxID=869754 RepID=A0A1A0HA85_9ASCO|nr:hypothetical protein METBIDRAFT_167151 [Metschnikowia bicuspidata var. bicuspidata NRRL YB-4993]OBA20926.1 hypothetical protein METBIDRAFT_167151 [Metschnikowia bicuspidata var. bicuspidata NRRL YB-4993]
MPEFRIDFAPGEPHVALRKKGITYYVPSLFHMSLTYQHTVPLFIADVLRSTDPLKIYGQNALHLGKEGCFLIKNHPFKTFTIMGRMMLFESHEVPGRSGADSYQFHVLYIDDFLGENLTLRVKIEAHLIPAASLEKNDLLLKISGSLGAFNGKKQMLATEVVIRGGHHDIAIELAWWTAVLDSRKYIEQPWRYFPPKATIAEPTMPKTIFEYKDARKRQEKRRILVSSCEKTRRSTLGTGTFNNAMDSFVIHKDMSPSLNRSNSGSELSAVSRDQLQDVSHCFRR